MDFTSAALFYGVLLISLVVHEAAHAVTALWGGDRTAYLGGQVTLNPIPHIRREPFGTVLLPIGLLFISNGTWCMGSPTPPSTRCGPTTTPAKRRWCPWRAP